MRRSTQKEVKDIQRELALAAGHQTKLIATGRLLISELYSFYSQRGYTLTPYANGQLNLTWIGSPGEPSAERKRNAIDAGKRLSKTTKTICCIVPVAG